MAATSRRWPTQIAKDEVKVAELATVGVAYMTTGPVGWSGGRSRCLAETRIVPATRTQIEFEQALRGMIVDPPSSQCSQRHII